MALTFADTHNMIAFLTKSNASEGFDQVVDFLNAHVIQYALMVDPTIYVSCIKQFWTFVSIKKANDVVRLQALIDRRKEVKDVVKDENDDKQVSAKPTPALTPPPSPTQEHIPSPPQAQTTQPSSPPQPQPLQTAEISMTLLNTLLETCATMAKQVANLEQDKIAQGIEITKLKQNVRRLEKKRQYKSSGLQRLRKGRLEESQAKVYHLDLEHAEKVLSMQDTDEAEPAKVKEVIEVVTATKLMTEVVTTATTITVVQVPKASASRKRKGVVIQDPKEIDTALVIMHSVAKSKDKGKGIFIEEPKPLKKHVQIEQDEAFARELEAELDVIINWSDVMDQVKRKEKQDNIVMRYQALKIKPITKAQARKNMMKKRSKVRKKKEVKEKMTVLNREQLRSRELIKRQRSSKHIYRLYLMMMMTPLALKVPVVDYQIHHEHNKHYYKIIRADGTHQLFLSFITLLKNFDKEDLEILWKLVQERFQSSEPKNFLDDFLLNTLKIISSYWWKKYPLTRLTLEQMLNNVRLEVEEKSEMSLDLLRKYAKGLLLLVEDLMLLLQVKAADENVVVAEKDEEITLSNYCC
nr:hypothetical protein [Tanacetum cinerariifolium]